MTYAATASRTLTKAAADLERLLQRDGGPEPGQLRHLVDVLFDTAALIMQYAGDLEQGVEP
jgi:hypothetical protein